MTLDELRQAFAKHSDAEFLKFDRIPAESVRYRRRDLEAFALLDSLVPGDRDMVSSAEHDEIWLEVEPEALAAVATEERIINLIRCGVRYDKSIDSLAMFV